MLVKGREEGSERWVEVWVGSSRKGAVISSGIWFKSHNKIQISSEERTKMTCKLEENSKINGRWTKEEHEKFILGILCPYLGLQLYGKDWKKI